MAAANTDKFRKKKNLFSTTLNGSITADATSLTCNSLSGVPTDTAVTITIDRVDANGTSTPTLREDITGVVSGSNITNLLRGEGATTAQVHSNAAVVEITWETETWNDAVDGILVGHNQDGTHKSGSVLTLPQINDTSSDHQYVFAVSELAADRTVTLPLLTGNDEFVFKDHTQTLTNKTLTSPVLNTGVSGTAFLDEDDMASNSATKLASQQSIKAYIDGKSTAKASADEIQAGTEDAKFTTPKGLRDAGIFDSKSVVIQVLDGAVSTSVGDGKAYITIPEELNGMNLTGVHAAVITAGTTNTTDIQIRNVTDSVDMLSTKMTIDSTETSTATAATAAVIDTTHDDVVTNDVIAIDIDAVSTTAAKGLIVRLRFALP